MNQKIMKTFNNFKTVNRSLALVTIVSAASTMFFTSCQQDDISASKVSGESINDVIEEGNDSVFVNNFKFNYDNAGPTSASSYVKDVNFGSTSNDVTSRGITDLTPTGIALNVMSFVGMNFLNNVTSKGNNAVINAILGSGAGEMAKLNELSTKMDAISGMIKDLKEQTENNSIAGVYNQRMKEFSGLDLNNSSYFTAYFNAVRDGKNEQANSIANEWAKESFNGTTAATATYNYLNMVSQTLSGSQKTITDVYDYWVYQTTPWEHMGYLKREQLRASDICVATTGYLMAYAFYEQDTTGVGAAKIVKLNQAYKAFVDYYKVHGKVEHHDDKLVCQIQNAHIVFNKNIVTRNIQDHPWMTNGTKWNSNSLKTFMYRETNHDADYVLSHSMTTDEALAIYNYYNAGKSKKMSMEQIMKEVGFDLGGLTTGKTHIMTLNEGANMENEHFYNNNYFFKFNNVVNASNANNLMISNLSVGKMWLEKKYYTKSIRSYKVLRWWDRYDAGDKDFFRVDIDHRYTDMNAF